ncbi:hypothetical protein ABZT03_06905 [Streptomyces sp. NPDC005574]|uniref:alpha/beta fold hydrolase n=1 Tax=Streptomyces sp. NPDC005574 TaxID=3156891 RepID=UPI0033AC3B20
MRTGGRGYSDRVRAKYDESLFVRQLFELRDERGIRQPAHLVGASIGGSSRCSTPGGTGSP